MQRILNYIDGRFVEPVSGKFFDDIEPATGTAYALVPDSDARDVQNAVDASTRAFAKWSKTPAEQRSRILLKIADAIEAKLEDFARAESIDSGKPISLARSVDVPRAIANFRFFATAILHTESAAHITDDRAINYTLHQPIGTVGLISPWNLPLYLLSWKIAPALACGNCAIAKPSELTPMTAFMLGEICTSAGLPPGVLNIVHGFGGKAGSAIVAHAKIPAISFTGGTKTGAEIARVAAPMFKKLSLELGGKNPNIIFADADLKNAIDTSVRSSFSNQGQICLCGSRIFVEKSAHESFVEQFVARVKNLKLGDPLDESTQQGAVVSKQHQEKILNYIDIARSEGGKILCGGKTASAPNDRCRNGYFIEPTVITNLSATCRTNTEEIFGPVVTITPFETEAELIEMANCTQYGLAASLWTGNLDRAHRISAAIQSGIIWINCWMLRDLRTPFGGMKQSGVGREGGEDALEFFTEKKNICIAIAE